jgi:hypothetical protein
MPTTEIPKTEWSLFFDSFSMRHEGHLVTVEVDGEIMNAGLLEASRIPLEGVAVDAKDGENIISITIGQEGQLRHEIKEPTLVRLEQTDDGYDKTIEITSSSEVSRLELCNPR